MATVSIWMVNHAVEQRLPIDEAGRSAVVDASLTCPDGEPAPYVKAAMLIWSLKFLLQPLRRPAQGL
jgi:hypothetical protein